MLIKTSMLFYRDNYPRYDTLWGFLALHQLVNVACQRVTFVLVVELCVQHGDDLFLPRLGGRDREDTPP